MTQKPIEIANSGSDYEVTVHTHGDGSIEVRVDFVLSSTGRERFHVPRMTPGEARDLAERLLSAADWQDTH